MLLYFKFQVVCVMVGVMVFLNGTCSQLVYGSIELVVAMELSIPFVVS